MAGWGADHQNIALRMPVVGGKTHELTWCQHAEIHHHALGSWMAPQDSEPWGAYGFGLAHKHLPEMAEYSGLKSPPVFQPAVAAFAQGMVVSVPLHYSWLAAGTTGAHIHDALAAHFGAVGAGAGPAPFVSVQPMSEPARCARQFPPADGMRCVVAAPTRGREATAGRAVLFFFGWPWCRSQFLFPFVLTVARPSQLRACWREDRSFDRTHWPTRTSCSCLSLPTTNKASASSAPVSTTSAREPAAPLSRTSISRSGSTRQPGCIDCEPQKGI